MCRDVAKKTSSRKNEMVVKHVFTKLYTLQKACLTVELAITRSEMELETQYFLNDQLDTLINVLCQTHFFISRLKVPFATLRHKCRSHRILITMANKHKYSRFQQLCELTGVVT